MRVADQRVQYRFLNIELISFKETGTTQISEIHILNTNNMGDLHEQEMANHQKENHECRAECTPSVLKEGTQPKCTPPDPVDQTAKPDAKDSEIMIAADLNLYASPMTILQNCKKTNPKMVERADIPSSSSDTMIAADLKKYGNPLDEK